MLPSQRTCSCQSCRCRRHVTVVDAGPLQVKHEVIENEYRLPKVDGCPTKMHDIMTRTWEYEPKARPTMQAVCHEIAAIKGEFPYSKEVF